MYYVLRKMRPVSEAPSQSVWEHEFCDAIAAYMKELIVLAAPTKGVYVSCDGAVCAAKRRQQRLRRFKGPWIAAMEAQVRAQAGGAAISAERHTGWDQNALTPGSSFMAQLGVTLTDAGRRLASTLRIPVIVSTTAEAGEGEHKLLRYMRQVRPASCTIYGLDADLILLAMLLGVDTGADVHLLREAQEFERTGAGSNEWRSLSIGGLAQVMIGNDPRRIRDYVAAMSLLGNDFLPRSLTHSVRDDGIPALIAALEKEVWRGGLHLVDESGRLNRSALLALIDAWAASEPADMLVAATDAARAARRPPGIADSPEETALREWNAQPARWASLAALLQKGALRAKWDDIYRKQWRAGDASEYCKGLAWVWDYYSGRPVDQGWFFDEHLPPLWSDVAATLRSLSGEVVDAPVVHYSAPLPDWLHLLAVLPAESVRQLLPARAHGLMNSAAQFWPTAWSLFDVGRTQMWECEPVIPMIPERLLRSWVPSGSGSAVQRPNMKARPAKTPA